MMRFARWTTVLIGVIYLAQQSDAHKTTNMLGKNPVSLKNFGENGCDGRNNALSVNNKNRKANAGSTSMRLFSGMKKLDMSIFFAAISFGLLPPTANANSPRQPAEDTIRDMASASIVEDMRVTDKNRNQHSTTLDGQNPVVLIKTSESLGVTALATGAGAAISASALGVRGLLRRRNEKEENVKAVIQDKLNSSSNSEVGVSISPINVEGYFNPSTLKNVEEQWKNVEEQVVMRLAEVQSNSEHKQSEQLVTAAKDQDLALSEAEWPKQAAPLKPGAVRQAEPQYGAGNNRRDAASGVALDGLQAAAQYGTPAAGNLWYDGVAPARNAQPGGAGRDGESPQIQEAAVRLETAWREDSGSAGRNAAEQAMRLGKGSALSTARPRGKALDSDGSIRGRDLQVLALDPPELDFHT
jgi:hypothetical protein